VRGIFSFVDGGRIDDHHKVTLSNTEKNTRSFKI